MAEEESKRLMQRIRAGDELAAAELMDQYADRLVALARVRLSKKLSRRLDPEDIVQSACRSFFQHVRAGRYDIRESDDLWRLLAAITVHKSLRQIKRHSATKRALGREESADRLGVLQIVAPDAFSRDPGPSEAATLVEETEAMMRELSSLHRRIVEHSLQGHDVDVVAQRNRCSERTVQRAIEQARKLLEKKLHASPANSQDAIKNGTPRSTGQDISTRFDGQ